MFIDRREDGSISGAWLNRQWPNQEQVADDASELIDFLQRTLPQPTIEQKLSSLGLSIDDLKEALGLE